MGLLNRLNKIGRILLRYPKIGKLASSFFGAIEVVLLDTIKYLDRHTRLNYFPDLMKHFTRLYKSQVIPINESLEAIPAVSPTEEILGVVRRVSSLAISYCYCRTAHRNCDNDVWTCIHVGSAESLKEIGKRILIKSATLSEVENLIQRSNEAGLVHQLLTAPSPDYSYVICNCCPCCCVMLQCTIDHGIANTTLASNFVSVQNQDACDDCGICVKRCHFGARSLNGSQLLYQPARCVGCGLCVTSCKNRAIAMEHRSKAEYKKPLYCLDS
ncbi:MAG: ATP-binding protein [Candidatus Thorarchaeota archaeon]